MIVRDISRLIVAAVAAAAKWRNSYDAGITKRVILRAYIRAPLATRVITRARAYSHLAFYQARGTWPI